MCAAGVDVVRASVPWGSSILLAFTMYVTRTWKDTAGSEGKGKDTAGSEGKGSITLLYGICLASPQAALADECGMLAGRQRMARMVEPRATGSWLAAEQR
jgi:hypothetical protein